MSKSAMVETLIPKILANISYLGPTYITLEFSNVGTIAAQDVNFSYSLKGISDKVRQLKIPLLKTNETKTIFFQTDDGKSLGGIEVFKEKEVILQTKIQYHNVLDTEQTDTNLLSTSQNISLSEFIKQNDQISTQYEESFETKITRYLENISRHITDLSREARQTRDVLNNQLHISRLIIQHNLLVEDLSQNISDKDKLNKSRSKIKELVILLLDPYPDLRKEKIQEKLNELKHLDNVIYEKVWEYFLSLKWARVEK